MSTEWITLREVAERGEYSGERQGWNCGRKIGYQKDWMAEKLDETDIFYGWPLKILSSIKGIFAKKLQFYVK